MPALVDPQLGARDHPHDRLGVLDRCGAVVAPGGHERRAGDRPETVEDVMVTTGLELELLATTLLRRTCSVPSASHVVGEPAVRRVLGEPGLVEAAVGDQHLGATSLLRRHPGELVEGVARPTLAPRRGAEQGQAIDPLGGGDRQLLGDHAPEAESEHRRALPAQVVEEGKAVAGVVGHRRCSTPRDARQAQASLVVDEHLEAGGEDLDQDPHLGDRRAAAVEEQQPGSRALDHVVEVDIGEMQRGHDPETYRASRRPSA